ncbi:MAG: type II toxin-antitoxin system prevent-host-death family antitoxin [Planctomycetota bacterium]
MKARATSTIGAFDAKTRLSELLDRVEGGEVIVITRHGLPIAKLAPFAAEVDAKRVQRAIDGLLSLRDQFLRSGPALTIEEIKAGIAEGRR